MIRKELGEPTKTIKKTAASNSIIDVYQGFHVHYTVNDKMEAIEFFDTTINLFINSQQVFPGTVSTIKKILPDLEECFGSYISREASIGINTEYGDIVSILVGCKDYYN